MNVETVKVGLRDHHFNRGFRALGEEGHLRIEGDRGLHAVSSWEEGAPAAASLPQEEAISPPLGNGKVASSSAGEGGPSSKRGLQMAVLLLCALSHCLTNCR